ncbi:MAG: phospholipase D family protein [Blastocatellia bacterium]|nr:phospholipase D family protein [Blastocatellia bacterium]
MTPLHLALGFLLLALLFGLPWQDSSRAAAQQGRQKQPHLICFSPGGRCIKKIQETIDQAKISVLVQAYSFTSSPIAKALVRAHQRGVKVQVIFDGARSTEPRSQAAYLDKEGVPTFSDNNHSIAHNKIVIIDDSIVITGSLNFTSNADERNAENTLILRDENLAAIYTRNWRRHLKHSKIYRHGSH